MITLKLKDSVDARWLINCALDGIEKSYEKKSPRYNEMVDLWSEMVNQIRKQVDEEEFESLKFNIE